MSRPLIWKRLNDINFSVNIQANVIDYSIEYSKAETFHKDLNEVQL